MTTWCTTCDRPVEGEACEICGEVMREPTIEPMELKWKFFIVVTIIYLIWRLYQLISWLMH